jgi:hypothetical protein
MRLLASSLALIMAIGPMLPAFAADGPRVESLPYVALGFDSCGVDAWPHEEVPTAACFTVLPGESQAYVEIEDLLRTTMVQAGTAAEYLARPA